MIRAHREIVNLENEILSTECIVFRNEENEPLEIEAINAVLKGGVEIDEVSLDEKAELIVKRDACKVIAELPVGLEIFIDSPLFDRANYDKGTHTLMVTDELIDAANYQFDEYSNAIHAIDIALAEMDGNVVSEQFNVERDQIMKQIQKLMVDDGSIVLVADMEFLNFVGNELYADELFSVFGGPISPSMNIDSLAVINKKAELCDLLHLRKNALDNTLCFIHSIDKDGRPQYRGIGINPAESFADNVAGMLECIFD